MKQDIYGHKERYEKWKLYITKNGDPELTKKNSDIFLQFIFDMERGVNISTKSRKGARSPHRLNALRQKLSKVIRLLQERGINDVTKLNKYQIMDLFNDMRHGKILTERGGRYKSTGDYVKDFKAFWNWLMKINRMKKKSVIISNIIEDLDRGADEKPKWVYLDDKMIPKLFQNSSEKYAAFFEFMYDSGARVTEALSLQVRDIEERRGDVYVNISNEISKNNQGRKINLKISGKNVLNYVHKNQLKDSDLLFPFSAPFINRYLKELCKNLFGEELSKAGEKYSNISLYDFRHNSACFWIMRYKTNPLMMYRFGWKSEKYIHYYSEFLGMKDEIRDDDMFVDITKTELEREMNILKRENIDQNEELTKMAEENKKIWNWLEKLTDMNKIVLNAATKDKKLEEGFKKQISEVFSMRDNIHIK